MKIDILINKILEHPVFADKPPVLLDIGASGNIHSDWELISKYSECIAFDADSREFDVNSDTSGFKKLHLINAIVSEKEDPKTRFYLTRSPYCSSSLKPIPKELANWSFCQLFEIDKEVDLDNKSLRSVLADRQITYVDWFKTDAQGIDLRLFKNLPLSVQENSIVAEFEPGFFGVYEGEDKIADLLMYMDKLPFWLSDCAVKGTQRIGKPTIDKYQLDATHLNLRKSSCWAEFAYINTCNKLQTRELLLAVVFSLIKRQYGFALDVCSRIEGSIDKDLLSAIERFSLNELNRKPARSAIIRRIANKLSKLFKRLAQEDGCVNE